MGPFFRVNTYSVSSSRPSNVYSSSAGLSSWEHEVSKGNQVTLIPRAPTISAITPVGGSATVMYMVGYDLVRHDYSFCIIPTSYVARPCILHHMAMRFTSIDS